MKDKKKVLINLVKIVLVFFVISFFKYEKVYANEEGVSTAGFTFNIVYPENQISDVGYLNLLMTSGQKETITLTLENPLEEVVNVDIGISGAKTNKNGVIEYSPNNIPNDDSLKYPFETLVTGPEKVTLQPKETKNVTFDIAMPDIEFNGKIVGGISMIRSTEDDQKDKQEDGAQIRNRYRYVAPLVLQNNQNAVEPKLELKKVYAEQMNSRNTVFADFSNIESDFVNNMSVEVTITEKGKGTILYETKKTNMRMAPNTLMTFPISMQGEAMVPGDYTANILVKADNISETWTKDFKITKEEAAKYNERDVGLYEEKTTNWKLIVIVVVGSLFLIAIIYIAISKISKAKKDKKKKNMRKNKKKNK